MEKTVYFGGKDQLFYLFEAQRKSFADQKNNGLYKRTGFVLPSPVQCLKISFNIQGNSTR